MPTATTPRGSRERPRPSEFADVVDVVGEVSEQLGEVVEQGGPREMPGWPQETDLLLPLRDHVEVADLFQAIEHRLSRKVIEFLPAQIIVAALHVADAQRPQVFLQERDIFEEQLFL